MCGCMSSHGMFLAQAGARRTVLTFLPCLVTLRHGVGHHCYMVLTGKYLNPEAGNYVPTGVHSCEIADQATIGIHTMASRMMSAIHFADGQFGIRSELPLKVSGS